MTNQNSSLQAKLDSLSDIELKVLGILHMLGHSWLGYGECYYRHDGILCGAGNINDITEEVGGRAGLSKVLKRLRELELVTFARGLMTEDGEVAGSGNAINSDCEEALNKICEDRGWL